MDWLIQLDMFEGPLDLLLHLIEKSEVDIYEVPIAQITDQYMQVLADVDQWELEGTSDFLVMAATLLALKSRMLLPQQTSPDKEAQSIESIFEEDPREELVERLLAYKKYKRLGEMLSDKEGNQHRLYFRPAMDLTTIKKEVNPVEGLTPDDLFQAFLTLLKQEKSEEPVATVVREEISVRDRMEQILLHLQKEDAYTFEELLPQGRRTKEQLITTFLAILELMKLHQIICYQQNSFSEIVIKRISQEVGIGDESRTKSGH